MIAISWYDAVTFDLIRSGLSRTTFPSRGRLSLRRVLEENRAQRQLRLMRSKRSTITMGCYKPVTFDLIRSGLSRTTVVEV